MKGSTGTSMRSSSTYRIPHRVFVEEVVDGHVDCRGARMSVCSGRIVIRSAGAGSRCGGQGGRASQK
jgi:hypothetical protein